MGFAVPPPSPAERCALTAPFHPYPFPYGIGRYLSVALSVASPRLAVSEHAARRSSDFPLRPLKKERSDRMELSHAAPFYPFRKKLRSPRDTVLSPSSVSRGSAPSAAASIAAFCSRTRVSAVARPASAPPSSIARPRFASARRSHLGFLASSCPRRAKYSGCESTRAAWRSSSIAR